ncbi:MAG: hypothetical protein NZ551_02535 [Microscillaceae bacterium]|nr:hypothetical protein [Microscillaceae bacterium]MDW8460063.1 hypothetical protein [Cytophagales bacterium]
MSILLASTLKPCDDVRMYHKIACTLAEANPQELFYVLGFEAEVPIDKPKNIVFLPMFQFKRLAWKRLFANWILFRNLLKIQPNMLIICTFELLPASVLYKFFQYLKGKKIRLVYDIQENYFANVLYTNKHYPWGIQHVLAWAIRMVEWVCSFWINDYFLAERCYESELKYLHKGNFLLLENKVLPHFFQPLANNEIDKRNYHLALVGTISASYGLWQAIEFAEKLYSQIPTIRLYITGNCPVTQEYTELLELSLQKKFLVLNVKNKPLPYSEIVRTMQKASVILMPYKPQRNILHRIPTKMFECLFLQKIMLIQQNDFWKKYLQQFDFKSAIFIDFYQTYHVQSIWQRLQNELFYQSPNNNYSLFTWQKDKLLEWFDSQSSREY